MLGAQVVRSGHATNSPRSASSPFRAGSPGLSTRDRQEVEQSIIGIRQVFVYSTVLAQTVSTDHRCRGRPHHHGNLNGSHDNDQPRLRKTGACACTEETHRSTARLEKQAHARHESPAVSIEAPETAGHAQGRTVDAEAEQGRARSASREAGAHHRQATQAVRRVEAGSSAAAAEGYPCSRQGDRRGPDAETPGTEDTAFGKAGRRAAHIVWRYRRRIVFGRLIGSDGEKLKAQGVMRRVFATGALDRLRAAASRFWSLIRRRPCSGIREARSGS